MSRHIHMSGLFILSVVAIMVATNGIVRAFVNRHPDSPAAKGAAFVV